MPSVAVSIINYRTADLTIDCVESALADMAGGAHGQAIDGEVVVVDNASGDGSEARIADWIAERPDRPVRLIRSPVNGGFAAGHNIAIAATTADHVLLLNSDASLRTGCLSALVTALRADPAAGLAAPRLEDADGTPQTSSFRFHGIASEFMRGANAGPVTTALARWRVALGPTPDPARIQWASFACILLSRRMIDDIGPLDEGYFLYFEDTEYCLRARRAGWGLHWVPEARCVHHRGGSGPLKSHKKKRDRLPRYYYAGRTRFLYQRLGWAGLMAANIGWLGGWVLARLRQTLGSSSSPAARAEPLDIWTNTTRPLRTASRAGKG